MISIFLRRSACSDLYMELPMLILGTPQLYSISVKIQKSGVSFVLFP